VEGIQKRFCKANQAAARALQQKKQPKFSGWEIWAALNETDADTRPAVNYFFSSVVVVVVPAAGAAAPAAPAAASVVVVAGAVASAAGAIVEALSVVVVVEVDSVPVAGVSTVVDSVDFDSHDDRPAVRAKPRAATLNRLFILKVILKMGYLKSTLYPGLFER
jgi:hypothetical protein